MNGTDGRSEWRVGSEVDLIIYSYQKPQSESASCTRERGGIECPIDDANHACRQGDVKQSSKPFSGSSVCFCRSGFSEGAWRRRYEGSEFVGMHKSTLLAKLRVDRLAGCAD